MMVKLQNYIFVLLKQHTGLLGPLVSKETILAPKPISLTELNCCTAFFKVMMSEALKKQRCQSNTFVIVHYKFYTICIFTYNDMQLPLLFLLSNQGMPECFEDAFWGFAHAGRVWCVVCCHENKEYLTKLVWCPIFLRSDCQPLPQHNACVLKINQSESEDYCLFQNIWSSRTLILRISCTTLFFFNYTEGINLISKSKQRTTMKTILIKFQYMVGLVRKVSRNERRPKLPVYHLSLQDKSLGWKNMSANGKYPFKCIRVLLCKQGQNIFGNVLSTCFVYHSPKKENTGAT